MQEPARARIGRVLSSDEGRRWTVWAVFAVAALASILLVGLAGRGQTLKGDEWDYARRLATSPLLDAVFEPPAGKYLLALPMLLYKAAFGTIGLGHYLPYRLASLALTVAVAAMFLVLAARRVGYVAALPASVVLLFLGSAGEVTATPLRIPEQIALAAGLGMLLALERRDLLGDLIASGLLLVSVTSHPLGTAFIVAAAVLVLARAAPARWQRAWVFLVPGILFAAWYFTLRTPSPLGTPFAEALQDVPRFEFQSLSTMVAAGTGVFRSPFSGETDFLAPLCYALGVIVSAAVAIRACTTRLPASFWAMLAALLVLFAAPVFAPVGLMERQPYDARYIFPGVLILLLLLSEVGHGVRLGRAYAYGAATAAALVFAFSMYSNTSVLTNRAEYWAAVGNQAKVELAALDLGRGVVRPSFLVDDPEASPAIRPAHMPLQAWDYFRVTDAYGSPAYSATQLRSLPAPLRLIADIVLARALVLHLEPVRSLSRAGQVPPEVLAPAKSRDSRHGCIRVPRQDRQLSVRVVLPPGGVGIEAVHGAPLKMAVARFGDRYAFPLDPLPPGQPALLRIPTDVSPNQWRLLIRSPRQPVTLCALSA